jgi:hypothetical protein
MRHLTFPVVAVCTLLAAIFILQGCGDDSTTGPTNKAPEISGLSAEPDTVDPMGTSVITCTASDADGDSLSYAWNPQQGTISGTGDEVTWNATATPGSYSIVVTVTDEKSKSSSDTVYVTVRGGTLLVDNDGVLLAVDFAGNHFTFYDGASLVEVLGTRIFTGRGTMYEIDHAGGSSLLFNRPDCRPWAIATVVLPGAGFAFISNDTDSIYFADAAGECDRVIEIPHPSPGDLQSTGGTLVGNNLVMVDTRSNKIWQIDLATDQISSLAEITPDGDDLRDVDFRDGAYYTCMSFAIHRYIPGQGVTEIATIPGANHCTICVVGRYAYVGECGHRIHRVDIDTGQYEVFLDGLDDVRDIEFIPVTLTP